MDESINTANKKKNRRKPSLSVFRIAGEILVGTVTGFVIAVPVSIAIIYVILYMCTGESPGWSDTGEKYGALGFAALLIAILSFIILYGPATAFGVYLVGNIGKQTGSFLATAGGLFLGVPVIVLLSLYLDMAEYKALGMAKIILLSLMFLAAPIMETLCFNLTRRYKYEPKEDVDSKRNNQDE